MKTHTLILEVPDELYQWLIEKAGREAKTVEQVAIEILGMSVRKPKPEQL